MDELKLILRAGFSDKMGLSSCWLHSCWQHQAVKEINGSLCFLPVLCIHSNQSLAPCPYLFTCSGCHRGAFGHAGMQGCRIDLHLSHWGSFPICSFGVWKTAKCRKILHSLKFVCLGTGYVLLSLQEGDRHFQRMFCSTPGRGFKADGMIMWQDTTFSCLLLPDQLRADSSLSRPEVQKAGSWTRIHLVLGRRNQVQPHRATGCDTGSSGWVTTAMPWNAHREWPNQLSKAIRCLALNSGQCVSGCWPCCQSCSAFFCQIIWFSKQYFIPV